MSLLDEAKAATPHKGPLCGVGRFLSSLSPEMRTEVNDVLYDPGCTDSGLIAALKLRAMGIKYDLLSNQQVKYLGSWEEGT